MPGSCSGLTLLREIPDLGSFKNWELEKQEESRAVIRPTHPFRKDLAEAPCDPATPQCHHAPPQSRHTTIPSSGTAHVPKCWSPHPPGAWLEGDTKHLVCVKSPKKPAGLQHNRCSEESQVQKTILCHRHKCIFLSQTTPISSSKENNPRSEGGRGFFGRHNAKIL